MHRLRAVAVLMLAVAALAPPPAAAGTPADPELTDPVDDHVVQGDLQTVPVPVPGVSDASFDDVDITAAYFDEVAGSLRLTVVTTASWAGGSLAGSFNVTRGPTSYSNSTATVPQPLRFWVNGTAVAGLNGTAAASPDGLRIILARSQLGAVGGDVLEGLSLTTFRRDAGRITDPQVTQDDFTGQDEAGPGRPYTMARPPVVGGVDVGIVTTGNATGSLLTLTERASVPIQVRVSNQGSDDDAFTLRVTTEPPLREAPNIAALDNTALPRGQSTVVGVLVRMEGARAGDIRVTVTAMTERGATDSATATIRFAPPTVPRDVVPAGLDFLTPAAEAMGFDDVFDEYAEAALLALIVLLVILAVFLLVALAPSTLAGSPEPIAPPVAGGEDAPAGLLAAQAARKARAPAAAASTLGADSDGARDVPADAPATAAAAAAATAPAAALRIDEVTHRPDDPAPGEDVATEVVLRNDGGTRQVRVVLAVDGDDADEASITLPARATKTVRLGWTAGEGENRVRVRVLPA